MVKSKNTTIDRLAKEIEQLNSMKISDIHFEDVVEDAYLYILSVVPQKTPGVSRSSSISQETRSSNGDSVLDKISLDRRKLLAIFGYDVNLSFELDRSKSNTVRLRKTKNKKSGHFFGELGVEKLTSAMTLNEMKRINCFSDLDIFTRIGINIFNMYPSKGVTYFIACSSKLNSPFDFAKFIRDCTFLSKSKIGEYFGGQLLDFGKETLQNLAAGFGSHAIDLETAYRRFHLCLKLPGEAQKIEKILQIFSEEYYRQNMENGTTSFPYSDKDEIMVLLYAITMLNVDLHNPSNKRKMSKSDFVKNVARSEYCKNIPANMLETIYDDIERGEFITGTDNVYRLKQVASLYRIKRPFFISDHRQFVTNFNVKVTKTYHLKNSYKPRVLLLCNDCAIIYKIRRNTIGQKSKSVCKGIYRFIHMKIYPLNNPQYPRWFVITEKSNLEPQICFYLETDYLSDKLLEYAKKFMYETEMTHSVLSKIGESVSKEISQKYKGPKEKFDELIDEFKDNTYGRYFFDLKVLRS